jgi:uncharacterized protein YndB with AHSA1/START domain
MVIAPRPACPSSPLLADAASGAAVVGQLSEPDAYMGGMTSRHVVVERRIAASRGRVWEALTDLDGMERVLSSVSKVEVLTDGAFGVGTRWRETRRMFGKDATEEMRVTASEPPERYVVEAASHGTRYISEWLLRADGSTATTVRMTFTAVTSRGLTGLLAGILGGVGARAVSRAVAKDLDDVASAVEFRRD